MTLLRYHRLNATQRITTGSMIVPLMAIVIALFSAESSFALEPAPAAEAAGTVRTLEPHAFLLRHGDRLTITQGMEITAGDRIQTSDTGAVGVVFRDGTLISLGPDSDYLVEGYSFAPKQRRFSFKGAVKRGSVLYESGRIAKHSPTAVQLRTTTAAIGVRGTRFVIKVAEPEEK
ncbi:MAG: FecR domain-containing protein [Magnetococcales bacterium]|nr:FecR domain-containing protein [Magnetococcales bacterium]